jgi:2-polyprenyl-3-methyl-5-hydroxy-6-metoxy-1,4-benzoquinol methylase
MDLADATWDSRLSTGAFDVVLMGDVLEHLANPGKVLNRVRPLLRESGYLVISLPNALHWVTRLGFLSGHFEYTSFGTLDFTHLRFFTAESATELIEESGYRVSQFHPAIGGRLSGRFRPVWQQLANMLPGLFAYQLLFRAEP